MGFTTPCFIRKNTQELRKKLKEFGYNILNSGFHHQAFIVNDIFAILIKPFLFQQLCCFKCHKFFDHNYFFFNSFNTFFTNS